MKEKLLIIGASGHGKVAVYIAMKMDKWKNIEFLDNDKSKNKCMGFDVVGETAEAFKFKNEADFFIAIGDNFTREKVQKKLISKGLSIATLLHPDAIIGTDVEIGAGTIIMAGVIINSSTVIGKGCIVNTSSSLDHDNFIDDYVHISPGVRTAGTVKIGRGTWLGIGSIVSNNTHVCSRCIVGAGAIVIKDITKPGKYVGEPIRKID